MNRAIYPPIKRPSTWALPPAPRYPRGERISVRHRQPCTAFAPRNTPGHRARRHLPGPGDLVWSFARRADDSAAAGHSRPAQRLSAPRSTIFAQRRPAQLCAIGSGVSHRALAALCRSRSPRGRWPTWAPYEYAGCPFVEFPKFSPFSALSYLFPSPVILAWSQLAQCWWRGWADIRFAAACYA